MCACQVWLNFVAQFFSHLAEMDFWLTIFRPIMVLTFDPQTPKLAISCTCFVDDCVNLYHKSSASAEVADRNVTWYVL